ncbi:hypothetical protein [Shewanella cyperi]|uniref:hypothetical protein n=1 Tax=Shewanella cyperi TaxID=2814292 RepID=UPI001D1940C6|nr:hypothetical protein [Shewanella cyperi]
MKRLNGYPNGFFYLLIGAMALVGLSGLAMLPWVAEFKLELDVGIQLAHGWRQPIVVSHMLAAYGLLLLLGALWQVHIRAGWRRRENHRSGLILTLSLLLLALTGLGLYYLGDEDWQLYASLLHSGLGNLLLLLFLWHWHHGIKVRRATIEAAKHRQSVRHRTNQIPQPAGTPEILS